jgi:hypothetical protein
MKVFQDTQVVQYLQSIMEKDEQKSRFVQQYLKPLIHSGLFRILKGVKTKGFNVLSIVQFLACLPLMGLHTIGGIFPSEYAGFVLCQKDVFYRLKNNPNLPWRKIVSSISRRFLKLAQTKGEQQVDEKTNSPKCFLFDDTDITKTGQKIEGVSKIWSHVQHRTVLGFKALFLGFWDGKSFLPIDFSLHREKSKNLSKPFGLSFKKLIQQFSKKRQDDQPSKRRKEELDVKKTTMVIQMMQYAISQGVKASFVLCDSWFFCETLLRFVVIKKKMNLIAGVKMGKLTFSYQEKNYSPKALLNITKRKAKFCRKLKMHYIPLSVCYKGIEIQLFFVRYANQTKWRIIMNSDTKMSFLKTIEIYQIRWCIEVFFKETKQYLGLGKCQSNDFDAHIAHISMACILFMALALKKRFDCHETIGQLFRHAKLEMTEKTLATKMWLLFCKIIQTLTVFFDFDPKILIKKLFDDSFDSQVLNLFDNTPPLE